MQNIVPMLELWRKKRALRRELRGLEKKHIAVRDKLEDAERHQAIGEYARARDINWVQQAQLKTGKITRAAFKLGIKIPFGNEELWIIKQMPNGMAGGLSASTRSRASGRCGN